LNGGNNRASLALVTGHEPGIDVTFLSPIGRFFGCAPAFVHH
jgi:hypothetical protein